MNPITWFVDSDAPPPEHEWIVDKIISPDLIREHAIQALRMALSDLPAHQVMQDINQMLEEREAELEAAEADVHVAEQALREAQAGSDLHWYTADEREAIRDAEFVLAEAEERLRRAQEAL